MREVTDLPVQWAQLVLIMAAMPYTVGRLLAAHVDAGDGRCAACTTPGTGTPLAAWPCSLHQMATQARQRASVASSQRR